MPTKDEIVELLEDISDYMLDNDLECGKVGGAIYGRVATMLAQLKKHSRKALNNDDPDQGDDEMEMGA
jgi:hypothetical protein